MSRRVLLIGATGVFGSRLALLLSEKPEVHLILAARNRSSLVALQASIQARSPSVEVAVMDRRRPDLGSLRPWLVIDAAGPFQDSGYGLALAAIQAGAHYVDLADARGFVAGFTGEAVARSGASPLARLTRLALGLPRSGRSEVEVRVAPRPGWRDLGAAVRRRGFCIAAGRHGAVGCFRGAVRPDPVPVRAAADLKRRVVANGRVERPGRPSSPMVGPEGACPRRRCRRPLSVPSGGGPPLGRPAVRLSRQASGVFAGLNRR